ncbi:hypothetical protein K505DRAFT_337231 [Melanomma pulvis-pyrius CBS 109.77]|uniref:Uncharacterized protein n=1 Tax=Melanomma pulvis-pyrius CBS 109.77 TaxID=1314802 RepID=A0A6A6XC60_9PLEO|nr:hypothetical protein K505DRAFT_337231 [Melanomma pulvis-pyrius CBS 109.77]
MAVWDRVLSRHAIGDHVVKLAKTLRVVWYRDARAVGLRRQNQPRCVSDDGTPPTTTAQASLRPPKSKAHTDTAAAVMDEVFSAAPCAASWPGRHGSEREHGCDGARELDALLMVLLIALQRGHLGEDAGANRPLWAQASRAVTEPSDGLSETANQTAARIGMRGRPARRRRHWPCGPRGLDAAHAQSTVERAEDEAVAVLQRSRARRRTQPQAGRRGRQRGRGRLSERERRDTAGPESPLLAANAPSRPDHHRPPAVSSRRPGRGVAARLDGGSKQLIVAIASTAAKTPSRARKYCGHWQRRCVASQRWPVRGHDDSPPATAACVVLICGGPRTPNSPSIPNHQNASLNTAERDLGPHLNTQRPCCHSSSSKSPATRLCLLLCYLASAQPAASFVPANAPVSCRHRSVAACPKTHPPDSHSQESLL